jgi:hypothetical protein
MDRDPELAVTLSNGRRLATFAIEAVVRVPAVWSIVEPGARRTARGLPAALSARRRLDGAIALRLAIGWVPVDTAARGARSTPLSRDVRMRMRGVLDALCDARAALQAADASGRLWAAAQVWVWQARRYRIHLAGPPKADTAATADAPVRPPERIVREAQISEPRQPRRGGARRNARSVPPVRSVAADGASSDTPSTMDEALIRRDPALVQMYAARQALARASTIPEVKAIKDMADAAEIYAKRRQLGEEAEALAYKVKILALEKLGHLLTQARKTRS